MLSQAWREVLIKSVIQVIPSFAMDCFKIPLGLGNDIEVIIKKFSGVNRVIGEKYIGFSGMRFQNQKRWVEWALEI